MTTIRDVAAEAGVSVATVSRALNGQQRVSASTRARVRRVAGRLGYQPDDAARHLVTRSSTTVAMVVPDITNPFFPEIVNGVHRACHDRGRALLLLQSPEGDADVDAVVAQLAGRRLAGVVLVGDALPLEAVTAAIRSAPVVVVDRAMDAGDARQTGGAGVTVVSADHRAGGRLVGHHLAGLGHTRPAHVSGPVGLGVSDARRDGFLAGLAERGVDLCADLVVAGDFGEASGYEATRDLLAAHPHLTAIFAANDLMAIGAVRALDDTGRDVPHDVSVVGYDDIGLARYVRPALTTVRQPVADLGRRAVARLLDDADGGPDAAGEDLLPVELVVRASSAAPAGADRG